LLLELANKGRLNEEDAADVRAMAEEQSVSFSLYSSLTVGHARE
jgi:hypothetical protein